MRLQTTTVTGCASSGCECAAGAFSTPPVVVNGYGLAGLEGRTAPDTLACRVVDELLRQRAVASGLLADEGPGLAPVLDAEAREAVAAMHTSVTQVEEGVNLVNEASQLIVHLAEGASAVGDQANEISSALQEQRMASNEVSGSVENIARMAEDNAGRVHDVVDVANSLRSMAAHLRQEVSHFKIG